MARSKSMNAIFKPLDIKIREKGQQVEVVVDDVATRLFTPDGELTQNAGSILKHTKKEVKKMVKIYNAVYGILFENLQKGCEVQEGNLDLGLKSRNSSSTAYKDACYELGKRLQWSESRTEKWLETNFKKSNSSDGVSIDDVRYSKF